MGHSRKFIPYIFLLTLFVGSGSIQASATKTHKKEIRKSSFTDTTGKTSAPGKDIFFIYSPIRNLKDFKVFANQIARLNSFGRIDMIINFTSKKAAFEMPEGGSPWHEYAAYDRSLSKFFPDEKIVPFIPGDFVKNNRQLLMDKLKIIRNSGLSAGYRCNEPHFLPEEFFESYPHLRGPRVDHPRRSSQKEFAPCFNKKGTQEMYRNMVNDLFNNVPEIHTIYISMNDAGSGFCWADWLYSGPNGPTDCKNLKMSERVLNLVNVFMEVAGQTGHDVDLLMNGMFTDHEVDDIVNHLPDHCYVQGLGKGNFPSIKSIGSLAGSAYPVKGIINPLGILRTLNRKSKKSPQRYSLSFGGAYDRGTELPETVEKVIDIVTDNLKNPVETGLIPTLQNLKKLCVKWGGEESADLLFNAFVSLDEALKYKQATMAGLSTLYWGVSTRHITRPLVFAPQKLTAEEEKYFLPYIFNVSLDEARRDYMDIHGGSEVILPRGAVDHYISRLNYVSEILRNITHAPEEKNLQNMAVSLRIYSSIIRSCGNFYKAQVIRNQNIDKLSAPVHRPTKIPTWTGDQDLLAFNAIMRDELDNTEELIDLLKNGGIDLINHAKDPALEDTFLLGSNLIEQLNKKRKIMLDHWLDIEDYLTSPYK
jgi:hypothetical protein